MVGSIVDAVIAKMARRETEVEILYTFPHREPLDERTRKRLEALELFPLTLPANNT